MYRRIMVPVDLQHADRLDKALETAAGLARQYDSTVTYVGVTASAPSPVAHSSDEYAEKLEAFAVEQARRHGIEARSLARVSHDPVRDLNVTLLEAADELGAELIVMASHVPGLVEHVFASHAGYVASHAKTSVFVVR